MDFERADDVKFVPWLVAWSDQPHVARGLSSHISVFSLDGKTFAAGYETGTVALFNSASGECVAELRRSGWKPLCFEFAANVLFVVYKPATGHYCRNYGAEIMVLDASTLQVRKKMEFCDSIFDMAVSSDATVCLVRFIFGGVRIFDVRTEERLCTYDAQDLCEMIMCELKIATEPGKSDGIAHIAMGHALRMTRKARKQVLAVLAAPPLTVMYTRLVLRDGDGAILTRVLRFLL